ncbi:hypothetical protein [Amnibacterium endophyticum]|uniref:Thiol reductant ABC exporter subunit CydC n=1 Tax=Amnibacterium endophyticum TaxID=2109337 RepID=A0ABW4LGH1_9MICO
MTTEPAPTDDAISSLQQRLRRARRGAVVGAAVGLLVAVTLGLLLAGSDESPLLWSAVLLVPAVLLGAVIGHAVAGGRLLKVVSDAAGYDIAAERIKRAVAGAPEELTAGERARALRYAELAASALPAVGQRWVLLAAALGLGQGVRLIVFIAAGARVPDLVAGVLGVLAAACFAILAPQHFRAARQAARYLADHSAQEERLG